jgi:hypothetical protein
MNGKFRETGNSQFMYCMSIFWPTNLSGVSENRLAGLAEMLGGGGFRKRIIKACPTIRQAP